MVSVVTPRAPLGRPHGQLAPAGADLQHVHARPDAAPCPACRRSCGAGRRRASRPGGRTRPTSSSWSRRGTSRTARWTGRSGGGCCSREPVDRVALLAAAAAPRRSGARSVAAAGGRAWRAGPRTAVSRSASSVAVPVAHHVRLAEADLGVAAEPVEERRGAHDPHHRRLRAAAADALAAGRTRPARAACAPRGGRAASAMRARSADVRWGGQAGPDALGGPRHEVVVRPSGDGVRGHWTPSCGAWRGRGMTGRRRSHSAMPCRRMQGRRAQA